MVSCRRQIPTASRSIRRSAYRDRPRSEERLLETANSPRRESNRVSRVELAESLPERHSHGHLADLAGLA
jgi:hypothetical protein